MHLFKAAKKEVSDREAALAAVEKEQQDFIQSLKLQTAAIAKTLQKIPSPSQLESSVDTTSTTIHVNWTTPSWKMIVDTHVAQTIALIAQSSTPAEEKELDCGVGYELRYYKEGQSLPSLTAWKIVKNIGTGTTGTATTCTHTVASLDPNSLYTFEIRANVYIQTKRYSRADTRQEGKSSPTSTAATVAIPRCFGPTWSDWHGTTTLQTLTSEQSERTVDRKSVV